MASEGDSLSSVTGDYISGLTDGEGCFYVNVHTFHDHTHYSPQTRVHFYIKLRQDDLVVLEKVRNTLGIGQIHYQPETRDNHSPCYRYEICHRDELKKLFAFFENHPLHSPKKIRDLERIKTILEIIDAGQHLSGSGLDHIKQIKLEMHI